jgi:hypothetical protein
MVMERRIVMISAQLIRLRPIRVHVDADCRTLIQMVMAQRIVMISAQRILPRLIQVSVDAE